MCDNRFVSSLLFLSSLLIACSRPVRTTCNQQFVRFLHSQKRASCCKSPGGLLPCCHLADIRMRLHRLLRIGDNKSAASCQQAWCKLLIVTFYSQAWCKFFQQLAASLQVSNCNKSYFHRLAATCWRLASKLVKSSTCSKCVAFLAVYVCTTNSYLTNKN